MLDKQDLQAIAELIRVEVAPIKQDVAEIKERLTNVENDVKDLKQRMTNVENDIKELKQRMTNVETELEPLKKTALLIENEIAPAVRILAENHSDLAKNVEAARRVDARVGMLEFEMKMIKEKIKAMNQTMADKFAAA